MHLVLYWYYNGIATKKNGTVIGNALLPYDTKMSVFDTLRAALAFHNKLAKSVVSQ